MNTSELAEEIVEPVTAAIGAYGADALTRDPEPGGDQKVELGLNLLQTVYWRAGNVVSPLEVAVDDVAHRQGDQDARASLRLQIRKTLEKDEALVKQTTEMLHGGTAGDGEGAGAGPGRSDGGAGESGESGESGGTGKADEAKEGKATAER